MKKLHIYKSLRFTSLILLVSISIHINAQVTFGSNTPPVAGALIQLKENDSQGINSSKGLGLPRVALTQINNLNDILSNPSLNDNEAHTGLIVY